MNFLHGIPHFAISIAHMTEGEIVSGITFDPIKNEIFYAEKNNGAFFNNQRIRVSKKNNINDCLFVTGDNINKEIGLSFRKSGCAALDLAYVAAGRYDGYFQHGLCLWDIAAGIVLVKEAGGITNEINLSNTENLMLLLQVKILACKIKRKIE